MNTNINVPIELSGTVMSAVATSSRLKLAALEAHSGSSHQGVNTYFIYFIYVLCNTILLLKFLTRNKA